MQPINKRVLLLSDWFDPAYKAGGPIRSAVNFVRQMKEEFEIYVFTSDRDLNDIKPLSSIQVDKWIDYIPGVKVFYASPRNLGLRNMRQVITQVQPDFIYLNSMFSKTFTIFPLWLKRSNRITSKIILAPRGMLKRSALDFKRRKKKLFLSFLKWMKVPQLVTFQATTQTEKNDILSQFGDSVTVKTVANFPGSQGDLLLPGKSVGAVHLLFIGRIHPVKGLDILLSALQNVKTSVRVSIVGAVEDVGYRDLCMKLAETLPSNVSVSFDKEVPHYQITELIRDHHMLCLPTKGENFGHAIFESLAAGRPVLISDQTPWKHLSKSKAGWDIPISDVSGFTKVIDECAMMTGDQFNEWCAGAWNFCRHYLQGTNIKADYLKLFS